MTLVKHKSGKFDLVSFNVIYGLFGAVVCHTFNNVLTALRHCYQAEPQGPWASCSINRLLTSNCLECQHVGYGYFRNCLAKISFPYKCQNKPDLA